MLRVQITSDIGGLKASLQDRYQRILTNVTPTEYAAQMIKASTVLRDSIVSMYVRLGTGGRGIEGVPPTSLETSLIANLMRGTPVIMGMGAYNAFGYKLHHSHKLIVVTHDPDMAAFEAEGSETAFVSQPAEALQHAKGTAAGPTAWVWGGASIYEALLPYVDHVTMLKTRGAFSLAKKFPVLSPAEWVNVYSETIPQVQGEDRAFTLTVERRKKL